MTSQRETIKCLYENCPQTFTGEKPNGWVCLQPHPPTYGPPLYWCPKHGPEVMQGLYRNMLEHADTEGNA